VYGQITPTNYKILIMKNETSTNYNGTKQPTTKIQELFKQISFCHTNMILNPFFELGFT